MELSKKFELDQQIEIVKSPFGKDGGGPGRIAGIPYGKESEFLVEADNGVGFELHHNNKNYVVEKLQASNIRLDRKYQWVFADEMNVSPMKDKPKESKKLFDPHKVDFGGQIGVVDLATGKISGMIKGSASRFNYDGQLYFLQHSSGKDEWIAVERLRPASEIGETDPDWLYHQLKKNEHSSKESDTKDTHMSNEKNASEENIWDMFKNTVKEDFADGMQLASGEAVSLSLQAGILMAMKSRGASGESLVFAKKLFESEYGKGATEILLGFALMFLPGVKDQPVAKYLAKGARKDGFRAVGSKVREDVFQFIVPSLMGALNGEVVAMPDLTEYETPKTRIKEVPKEEMIQPEEEIEEEEDTKHNRKASRKVR